MHNRGLSLLNLATSRNYLWRKIIILFCDTKCDGIGFSDELAEQSGNTRG